MSLFVADEIAIRFGGIRAVDAVSFRRQKSYTRSERGR